MKFSRSDLLDVASIYLGRTGFQDTSMDDIAKGLNVPRSTLYYHFTNKGTLLFEILLRGFRESLERVDDIATLPLGPLERFSLAVKVLLKDQIHSPSANLSNNLHVDSLLLTPVQRVALVDVRDQIDARFRDMLQEAMQAKQIRPLNSKIVTFTVMAAIGRFQSWFREDGSLSLEEVTEITYDFFFRGLGIEQPAGPKADPQVNSNGVAPPATVASRM